MTSQIPSFQIGFSADFCDEQGRLAFPDIGLQLLDGHPALSHLFLKEYKPEYSHAPSGLCDRQHSPLPQRNGRHLRVPPEVNQYLQNEGWDKVRLLADDEELLPGIKTFWAGVHHRSSLAIAINTEQGKVILTDCFFKYDNIESGRYLGVMESI